MKNKATEINSLKRQNGISFTIQERITEFEDRLIDIIQSEGGKEVFFFLRKNPITSIICEITTSDLTYMQLDSQKRVPETNNKIEQILEEVTAKAFQILF